MRILLVAPNGLASEPRAPGPSLLQFGHDLVSAGHAIEIVIRGSAERESAPTLATEVFEGLRIHRIHLENDRGAQLTTSFVPELEPLLGWVLRDFQADLVHVHGWRGLSRHLVEIFHDQGVPTVVSLHDYWSICPLGTRIRDSAPCKLPAGGASCFGCAETPASLPTEAALQELDAFARDFRNEVSLARRLIVSSRAQKEVFLRELPELVGSFRVLPPYPTLRIDAQKSDLSEERSAHIDALNRLYREVRSLASPLRTTPREHRNSRLHSAQAQWTRTQGVISKASAEIEALREEVAQAHSQASAHQEAAAALRTTCLSLGKQVQILLEKETELRSDITKWEVQSRTLRAEIAGTEEQLLARSAELAAQRRNLAHLFKTLQTHHVAVAEVSRRIQELGDHVGKLGEFVPTTTRLRNHPIDWLRAPSELALVSDTHSAEALQSIDAHLTDLLETVLDRELVVEKLLGDRENTIIEMAKSLDHVLDTLQLVERRRRTAEHASSGAAPKSPSDRLKILFVVHQFLPRHVAGTEIYTFNLAKELSKRHEVVILSAESDHSRPRFEHQMREYGGLRIHQIIHNYTWSGFRDTYDSPEADAHFRSILSAEAPDLVHIQHLHYFSANFVTIAKCRNIPVVYTLHDYMLLCPRDGQMRRADGERCLSAIPKKCADCIAHHSVEGAPTPPIPRGLRPGAEVLVPPEITRFLRRSRIAPSPAMSPHEEAIFERLDYLGRVLKDVDLFISPSTFLRKVIGESGLISKDKILVSDNGFDVSAFRAIEHTKSEELRVGYVGTIAEHKGLHVLIEAMNGIDDPRVHCRIWGELSAFWEYTESLKAAIRNPRILLMGSFPPTRTAEVLSQIDVLVVPSLWWENSPLTLHEAALAKIPVIASNLGGLAEYVVEGKTGVHFEAGDAADLRAKILAFRSPSEALPGFDPSALKVKTVAEDARDMEARYFEILARSAASS